MSERELQGSGRQETTGARFGAGRGGAIWERERERERERAAGRGQASGFVIWGKKKRSRVYVPVGQAKIWAEDECKRA